MRLTWNPTSNTLSPRIRAGIHSGVVSLAVAICLMAAGLPAQAGNDRAPQSVLRSTPVEFSDLMPARTFGNYSLVDGPLYAASGFDEFDMGDADKVNVAKATLFSFVLPGAGQWYAGERTRAGVFLAAEGIAWATFGYFETVGAIKRTDYEAYALANAGIDPTGKDEEFYRILSFYDSRDEYNSAGRIIEPQRPYYPDVSYWDWQWKSADALEEYRNLRNQSNEAFNRGKLTLGALLLNRLVSAVDAWRTAKSVNRHARMEQASWKLRIKGKPFGDNPKVMLTYGTRF